MGQQFWRKRGHACLVLVWLLCAGSVARANAEDGQLSWDDLRHPKKASLESTFCRQNTGWTKQFTDKLHAVTAAGTKATGISVEGGQRQFEIGLAMYLCHGGFHVAGTVYSKMSQADQNARQKALDEAVAHQSKDTTTYVLPDHPEITGTITPVSTIADNGQECSVFKDTVAEGSQNDSALNKYCRTPPANEWKPQLAI